MSSPRPIASGVDFVAVGETMAVFTAPRLGRLRDMEHLTLGAAGSESNVAIGISRLGYRAAWIGRTGSDEFGALIRAKLAAEGVDVSHALIDPTAQTALMFKEHRLPEVVRVTYYRRGFAGSRLCPEDLDPELFSGAKVVHVTGISLGLSESAAAAVERAVELARAGSALVSFDLNYRAALWDHAAAAGPLRALAEAADVVFAGEDELAIIGDGEVERTAFSLLEHRPRVVVIKRGAKGAAAVTAEGITEEAARPVAAVDPVGAGDGFVAGYLAGILDGGDLAGRLRLGCAVGAYVVATPGDWEGLPSRADLDLMDHGPGATLR